jgi:hypothetical protein
MRRMRRIVTALTIRADAGTRQPATAVAAWSSQVQK